MATSLTPYLVFDGTAREAMTFYADVLGGRLDVVTFGQYGMEGEAADGVMHAHLLTDDGMRIMASDGAPGDPVVPGSQVNLCLNGDDLERVSAAFARLGEGGEVHVELAPQMWGDTFGQCRDRFGIVWMANVGGAPAEDAPA
ncbi:VOC family protein [Nocardioides perillae]|uniref:PhnB protein n=1 Tax=Nocardioides perillae TaxID=1119534 RepID=A0A7Y9RVQ1_9ACTN|nr:VOC family protein [Nocardioides perillae]NYG54999.1 PhnB protein [Nocardioides perillae]